MTMKFFGYNDYTENMNLPQKKMFEMVLFPQVLYINDEQFNAV